MAIRKSFFGINPDERQDAPAGLRGKGVEGGKGIFDEYFNQILFETQADHIIDTEANVKLADDPRGTCYYSSTATEFQDRNDATVNFSAGDRIVWKGLDAITANIDISTIDDLEHIMFQGVTVAFGSFSLSLGYNQRGELKYSGGPVIIKSGPIQLTDTLSNYEEFETEGLIINFQSNTTIDLNAESISFFNVSTIPTRIFDVDETFDITTDLMLGTSEKTDALYWLWLDSERNRRMVPDIAGVTTGTSAGFLVDAGNTFATDNVTAGDIIFNETDLTRTTVLVTPTVDGNDLAVTDDIFTVGENYKIRILSPEGLGSVKARLGAGFNNSSGNLDNSIYTKPPEKRQYTEAEGYFTITDTNWTTLNASAVPYQTVDGRWRLIFNIDGTYSVATTTSNLAFSGVVFLGPAVQAVSAGGGLVATNITRNRTASGGSNIIEIVGDNASEGRYFVSGDVELSKKPTWAE